jgi:hypothetical protein
MDNISNGDGKAAENISSSMKRMFGGYVISIIWKDIVKELLMKNICKT